MERRVQAVSCHGLGRYGGRQVSAMVLDQPQLQQRRPRPVDPCSAHIELRSQQRHGHRSPCGQMIQRQPFVRLQAKLQRERRSSIRLKLNLSRDLAGLPIM